MCTEIAGIRLRPADETDVDILYKWVNSSDNLRWKKKTVRPIKYEDHKNWFISKINHENTSIKIIMDQSNERLGQIRLENIGDFLEVDIFVEPKMRGKNIALRALELAMFEFKRKHFGFRALVHVQNTASVRLFNKAGFVEATPQCGCWIILEKRMYFDE